MQLLVHTVWLIHTIKRIIRTRTQRGVYRNMHTTKGFTLIEMMVAVALFAVVMTVSISALLSLVDANRKAQAIQSVMNNLNVSLDGMVRAVRMGTTYHCGCTGGGCSQSAVLSGNVEVAANCLGNPTDPNGKMIAFEPFGGDTTDPTNQWVYWFENGRLYKSEDSGQTAVAITAPEVHIDSFRIYVKGAEDTLYSLPSDNSQPLVIIVVEGTAGSKDNSAFGVFGAKKNIETNFKVQAAASQRLLDI